MEAHCICQKIKVKVVIFITVQLFAGKPLVTKPNTFADQVHHFMATTLPDRLSGTVHPNKPQKNSSEIAAYSNYLPPSGVPTGQVG